MLKRILLGCYEVPGWGGAATSRYRLFRMMQRDGHDVAYVNLVKETDQSFFTNLLGSELGNPEKLQSVYTCVLGGELLRVHRALSALIREIAPDLMLGCGFIAAHLMKRAAPELPLIFMTSGCRQVKQLIENRWVRDFVMFEERAKGGVAYPVTRDDPEHFAVESSDIILVHSPLIRTAFGHFYPAFAGKLYAREIWTADLSSSDAVPFGALARPFAERDIDVAFIANDWSRKQKNARLMNKLVRELAGLSVHVVGMLDSPLPSAECHGVIAERRRLYELLGRAKTVVCPSLFDPAPGVLFEASAMGCNVVASPNCGNWRLCHERLVAEECSLEAFLRAIDFSLRQKWPDNAAAFRGGYETLLEVLDLF
jgi:glycosyltransferase involved in cell wall biosynthesis